MLITMYSARAQDGQQEMERNEASAKHVVWPSCAWLLLRFFPYPVGHPDHEHCTPHEEDKMFWHRSGTCANMHACST